MIIAAFNEKDTYVTIYGLYQYDYGQVLRIQGLNLPSAVEMHFALQDKGGESITRIGTTKDGVTDVLIPDSMLENNGTSSDYKIYAFVYIADEISGKTERRIEMSVKSRPKPEAFDCPEDAELFREAIKAVNESATRSAESERQAEGWAHGREGLPEREQDNAKYYSEQAKEDSVKTDADRKEVERLVESVSGIDEQVETIRGYSEQAQTSATNAALSESAAKESENNAAQARAGAEVAEDNAELAAQKAEKDKSVVEQAKDLVKQIGQEVLDNKNLVDDTVHGFELRTQQAVADVNNAGQTQTERVQTAGNTAVESVESAQRTATEAVETAKTEAIKTIQEEGVAQIGTVAAEGEKQVQAVQDAAAEIVADRQQIQKNAVDIESLGNNKADAIVSSASGEQIVLTDSDNEPFKCLHVYGKSTQVTTTGAQLLNPNKYVAEVFGIKSVVENDGSISIKGITNKTGNFRLTSPLNIDITTEMFFGMEVESNVPFSINHYNNDYTINAQLSVTQNGNYNCKYESLPTIDEGIFISLGKQYLNSQIDINIKMYIGKLQEYEPYTGGKPSPSIEYPQEIVSVGDKGEVSIGVYGGNLFNVDAEPSDNNYNYQNYIKNNGIYIKNMKRYEALRFKFTVQKYTDITLSAKILSKDSFVQLSNFGLGGSEISESILFGGKHNITVNTAEHNEIVISFYSSANIVEYKVEDVIVNVGSNNLTFEPYKDPQTLALTTPNGLPGVPVDKNGNYIDTNGQLWAVDEKDLARGKYVQRIYITEINESMIKTVIINWEKEDKISYKITTNLPAKQNQKCLSNRFVYGSYPYLVAISGKSIYFEFVDKKEMPTVEKFKQFLTDNKTTVAYILETPIEHDLTPEVIEQFKQLKTNYPTTVIMNDENAGMKVSYVADIKHYIDKKFKELNQAIVNTQISLL